jgi:hypothetical protein
MPHALMMLPQRTPCNINRSTDWAYILAYHSMLRCMSQISKHWQQGADVWLHVCVQGDAAGCRHVATAPGSICIPARQWRGIRQQQLACRRWQQQQQWQ